MIDAYPLYGMHCNDKIAIIISVFNNTVTLFAVVLINVTVIWNWNNVMVSTVEVQWPHF